MLLLFILSACLPCPAYANVGVAMVIPFGLLMLAALLPVIGLEAWVLSAQLDIGLGAALRESTWANVASTMVSVPLSWLLGAVVVGSTDQFLPRTNAPWKSIFTLVNRNLLTIRPDSDVEKNIVWLVPSAQLIFLVHRFSCRWWLNHG